MRTKRSGFAVTPVLGLIVLATAGLVFSAGFAEGAVVRQHYEFDEPVVTTTGKYDQISMDGTWSHGEPGEPVLPMSPVRLLLPPGEVIAGISIIPGEKVTLDGHFLVEPGRMQRPLSFTGPYDASPPKGAIYGSSDAFPVELHDEPHTGLFRGHRIATFALNPVEYIPAEGRLSYWRSIDVEIETVPSTEAMRETETMIRRDARTRSRLGNIVDNTEGATAYDAVERVRTGGRDLDPALGYTYLIIATESWDDIVQPLVAYQTERGHKTGLFLLSWILANYTAGVDDQEDIRDFIIDAYATWDIDFVLLVGDARDSQGIPVRGLYSQAYSGQYVDDDIAADMYYGCLDGTWNDDGDGRWGEPGEDDLYHEVAVGRACVDSESEASNFVTKVTRYPTAPILSESDEAVMVGELLWSGNPNTWGGDYKDQVKDGSSAHGYTTVGFPASMNVGTLYDRDGTWSYSQLITLMENGMNIVNHLGHCNVTYAMKMTTSDIPSFDNDGTVHSYNFVYGQGCYSGSLDNRNSGGGYESDCFAEQFQVDDDGAVAVVMNSRYGFGDPGGTNGSSQYYDREFFDAMFGEGIYAIGEANDDSKMDVIWAINYGANRWCYYELNVFGDPAMELWTAEPADMDVTHPESVFLGVPVFEVTVNTSGGAPIEGACVTVFTADYSTYDTGLTDASGQVTLSPQTDDVGTLYVTVTAHDCLSYSGEAEILPPDGPYLVFDTCAVFDDTGDADGELDAGESVGLDITLENVGVDPASGVSALLTSEDPYVTVVTSTRSFPNIPAGGFGTCVEPYELLIAGNTPDQHLVAFDGDVTANEGTWGCAFGLVVQAPVIGAGDLAVNDVDQGNGDGGADPGETVDLQLWLSNTGHSDADMLTGVITCTHPHIVVIDGTGECAAVPAGGSRIMGDFQIEVLPSCPSPEMVDLDISISAASGYETTLVTTLAIGPWFDDVEDDRGWTCGAIEDDAGSGHWVRAEPIGTEYSGQPCQPDADHTTDPGITCFVTANGSVGGSAGEADVDGGSTTLLSPVFDLSDATSATLGYWRWYTNDLGNNPGEDYWTVDVTADGENWAHLEYTTESANSWNEFTFNVGDYVAFSDRFQVRFIATDESPGSLVEAAVDDFTLDVVRVPVTDAETAAVIAATGLVSVGPNPFNPRTSIVYQIGAATHAKVRLYDVSGRCVRTLVDGPVVGGEHRVYFDGTSDSGLNLASGVYFLLMETPDITQVRQLTLLK